MKYDFLFRYPPGHGDVFASLEHSGLLEQLIEKGIEYLFVSNIDNLGATVDLKILSHFASKNADFLMEVTEKTKSDIKGGTLVCMENNIRLLEIAQVAEQNKSDFMKRFKIFNTNNIWLKISSVKNKIIQGTLELDVIANPKQIEASNEKVLQLETAVGSAIKFFENSIGLNVPRTRFLPVKNTSDLFLLQSDLYTLNEDGNLVVNNKRPFQSIPIVKLGDNFKKVSAFQNRILSPPHILELDHLTVSGDVTFGSDVVLKGNVIIVANHGSRIDIPSGAVLEDKVISGSLRIMDH